MVPPLGRFKWPKVKYILYLFMVILILASMLLLKISLSYGIITVDISFKTQSLMSKKKIVKSLPTIEHQEKICKGCGMEKHSRNSFLSGKSWKVSKPLEFVHSDLCGPKYTISIGGNHYFLSIIDDYCRKTWIYFAKIKSKVFSCFRILKLLLKSKVVTTWRLFIGTKEKNTLIKTFKIT